jgi:hypothetical protein
MTRQYKKAWDYFVETGPAVLTVPLSEVKTWLKVTHSNLDAEITSLIESATQTGEKLTRRDFINKGYRTFRDGFSDMKTSYGNYAALIPYSRRNPGYNEMELRRSRLQTVDSIEYLKDDVWTAVDPSVYYNTQEKEYSKVLLADGQSWPGDVDNREQAVRIDFTAGYGATGADVPADIKLAIKQHVANAFANHGDCFDGFFLPPQARGIYNQNRILEIGA